MIIGGGKTGFYLAKMLSEFGAAVKVIEKSKDRCRYLSSHLNDVMVLHGDATDLTLLEEENLSRMDAVVNSDRCYDERKPASGTYCQTARDRGCYRQAR